MARFDISLLGDKELSAKLAGMTEKLERKVLSGAFRKSANTVKADAQRRVTHVVTPKARVGRRGRALKITKGQLKRAQRLAIAFSRLASTIHAQPLKRRKHRVGYGVLTGTRAQLGIAGRYYYPAHVEAGHGPPHRALHQLREAVRRELGSRRTPPHPYLRPALKSNEGAIMAQLAADIRAGIEKEAPSAS